MKVLVVGSGGREHALCWRLKHEGADVFCAPGNPGIAEVAECFNVKASDLSGIEAIARRLDVDLVVIGPEQPLIDGLADHLRASGISVFGPDADAAKLEGSKRFSKELMESAGVPTAGFGAFTDAELALDYARSRFDSGVQVAVKASGNALGKGVVVCHSLDEAEDAIAMMLVEQELGHAGSTIVIEDRLEGPEFSLLTLVSGKSYRSLPVAQDYKRALDGHRGPNTGGMGSLAPAAWVSPDLIRHTEETVVAPILSALPMDFRGVLFSGLIVQDGKPYCLEYNVRFGDPETQSVMRLVGAGFLEALVAVADGETVPEFEVLAGSAITIVLASQGYPGAIKTGIPIEIDPLPEGVVAFHGGTALKDGHLITSGGRVLSLSAIGATQAEARARAYEAVECIRFAGMHYRRDIGE